MPGRRKEPGGRSAAPGQPTGTDSQPASGGSSLFVPGYSGEPGRPAAALASRGRHGAGIAVGKGPVRGFPPAPGQPPPLYPPGQFSAWNRARHLADGFLDGREAADGRGPAGRSGPGGYGSAGAWPPGPGYAEAGYAGAGNGGQGYGGPGYGGPGYGGPAFGEPGQGQQGYADPGYSVLAVSDPAADVTSTQSWAVVDASRAPSGWAGPGASEEPPPAEPGEAGHTVARPHSDGPPRGPGRPPEPPPGPAPRTDRPHARRAHGRARSGKRPARGLLACGLVLAMVAGAAAYFWLSSGHRGSSAGAAAPRRPAPEPSQTQPATPTTTPSLGRWGHIETRAADPLPLTLGELFPARFSAGGSSYTRTAERDGTDCARAVIGSALQAAVRRGKCSQVMRASYLAGNGKLMGTIGVLNLISVAATERAGKAAGGADFIDQLPAAKGPTHQLTKGTGLEETEIKGHYLVTVWAEFANLHAPKTPAQRLELVVFCNRLIQNTANLSLASRLVTGKPRAP